MNISSKLLLPAAIIFAFVVVGAVLTRRNDTHHNYVSPTPTMAEEEKAGWHDTLSDAQAEAKERKSLILVDAYADWCIWCKKLDAETLSNTEVQARLKDFTLLKLDTDRYPDIAAKYGISGLPTTLVLDAEGKVVLHQVGFMITKEYLRFLDQATEAGVKVAR